MPTKIYVVFFGKPKGIEGWPNLNFDCEQRKKYLFKKLKNLAEDTEFAGGDIIYDSGGAKRIKEKIEKTKKIDGIVLYTLSAHFSAPSPEEILNLGHPALIVSDIFGGDIALLKAIDLIKKKKIPALPISSSGFSELKRGLNLIKVIHKLKESKILAIGKSKDFGDQAHFWRRSYENFLNQVRINLGVKTIILGPERLNKYYEKISKKIAAKVAANWIRKSVKVVEPTKGEIIKSARFYLAMKGLLNEFGADAITIDCLPLFYERKIPAYPCLGHFQLNNEGLVGVCEEDLEAALTHLMGQHLTQRPGFVSDPVIDTAKSQIIYAHCVASARPFGKNNLFSRYKIRSHAEDGKGASVQVFLPKGYPLTTVKLNVLDKKLAIHQAKSIGNIEEERACRTKLAAKANVKKILENWDFRTFGWHRVTFFGDFREDFCNLATLLGLTVVEEDK